MKTSRPSDNSCRRSRLKGNARRLKRTTIIILLIIIHQFSLVSGYSSFVCIDHEPCRGGHDEADTHLAFTGINLFDPPVCHNKETNFNDQSDHCACKCPGSEQKHQGGGRQAFVSNTTLVHNVIKFSTVSTMFRISIPVEFKFLASDCRIRGEESPASLDALQSVLLLI